jgi:glyoxylase-like metal-dependent hydrolase (beta-lactamase superfamily II)
MPARQDGPVDEVADGVLRIALGFVNAYLVVTDDGLVLVDTGLPRTHAKLHQELADARRSVGDIRTVLLTHWHTDHTGGLPRVRAASGARVVASAVDAPVVTGAQAPPLTTFLKLARPLTGEPGHSPVDEALAADGPFSLAGFTAVQTPGHTAGHVSFLLDRGGGFLFAGDAAASGRRGRLRHGPRLVTENRAAAERSVAKLAALDFDVAVFGHGAPVKGRAVERFRELAAG